MSDELVRGTYGGVPIELNKSTGILKMANKQGVLMRVRLVNRLFGSIMRIPLLSTLLRDAGKAMGEDYAISWLLENKGAELPADLRAQAQHYQQMQRAAEEDSMDPGRLTQDRTARMRALAQELDVKSKQIRSLVIDWLRAMPGGRVRALWQEMHDEDVYAGWGKSDLVGTSTLVENGFDRDNARAHIQVSNSFVARLSYYWEQQGHGGQRICSLLEGYFLGEARVIFGREDLTCSEISCRLQGADTCQFIIEPEGLS